MVLWPAPGPAYAQGGRRHLLRRRVFTGDAVRIGLWFIEDGDAGCACQPGRRAWAGCRGACVRLSPRGRGDAAARQGRQRHFGRDRYPDRRTFETVGKPGLSGDASGAHSAAALAHHLVNAPSLHGQVADPFSLLIRSGIAPHPEAAPERPPGPAAATGRYADLISEINENVELRIERRTRELLDEAHRLDRVVKELQSFSYTVSHDLRGPLQALGFFVQVLREHASPHLDELGNEYLDRIDTTSFKMSELINGALGLARLERATLDLETVDLSGLADEVIEDLDPGKTTANALWEIEPRLVVKGDRSLLRILLQNLFENAYKFTSRKAVRIIELGRVVADGKEGFFVRDNGAGFDPEHAELIFEPFRRLHDASEYDGTGIGLATVRRIVRLHGGNIRAESAPDRGTTIFFRLGSEG